MKRFGNILAVIKLDDENGNVGQHVTYLLDRLGECLGEILVLASSAMQEEELLKKGPYNVFVYQEDETIDTLWRRADLENKAMQYEKVMVMDGHCFGPVDMVALSDMLEEINKSCLGNHNQGCYEIIPGHLAVFGTIDFQQRMVMTGTWEEDLWGESFVDGLERTVVSERFGLVFFDIESLMDMDINISSGENPRKILDKIKESTYDIKLVWDYLLGRYNVEDIKNALHLEYILPWKNNTTDCRAEKTAALIAHLYYEDMVSECFYYLEQIPKHIDIYITTSSRRTLEAVRIRCMKWKRDNYWITWKENRGRDVSALLVTCRDILMKYEYIGFVHDKKSESYLSKKSEAASFQYNIWENMLKSREYIGQIMQCFTDNPRLGLLVPPEPYYASLMGYLGKSWGRCYDATKEFAQKLGLDCQLEEEKLPVTVSTTFWCRTEALEPLFAYPFQYGDFPQEPMSTDGTFSHVIEHVLAYVAQHQRFYTGILMNSDYASLRGSGLQRLLISALNEIRKEAVILKPGDITEYRGKTKELLSFCRSYESVFIYGTGTYGARCAKVLSYHHQEITAFVVSEGRKVQKEFAGKPVYSLSELRMNPETCGIILALNIGNQRSVIPNLDKYGFHNRISII